MHNTHFNMVWILRVALMPEPGENLLVCFHLFLHGLENERTKLLWDRSHVGWDLKVECFWLLERGVFCKMVVAIQLERWDKVLGLNSSKNTELKSSLHLLLMMWVANGCKFQKGKIKFFPFFACVNNNVYLMLLIMTAALGHTFNYLEALTIRFKCTFLPPENIKVFWCFQGVEKGCTGT